MSLERQDVRTKLDPADHAALVSICDLDGKTIAEFIEAIVVPVIRKRVHDANLLAVRHPLPGISGNNRESPGSGQR
jgi:hypothetical protein